MAKEKKKRAKKLSQAAQQLREAIRRGKIEGLWTGAEDAGRVIGENPHRVKHAVTGDAADATIMDITKKVEQRLPQEDTKGKPSSFHNYYELGCKRGLWGTYSECGKAIGLSQGTVSKYAQKSFEPGSNKATTMYNQALERIRSQVEGRVETPSLSFREYFLAGREAGLWKGFSDCAKAIEHHSDTVSKYSKEGFAPTSAVGTTKYNQAVDKIRTRVEAKRRRSAKRPKEETTALQEAPPPQALPPPEAQSLEAEAVAKVMEGLTTLFSHSAQHVLEGMRPTITKMVQEALADQGTRSVDVIDSTWVDDVVAGRKELAGQNLPGVRFALTKETFRTLLTQYTRQEDADTSGLIMEVIIPAITELRRRLTLGTQMEDLDERMKHVQALGREIDELSLAIRHSRDAVPSATAEEFDRQRAVNDSVRKSLNG